MVAVREDGVCSSTVLFFFDSVVFVWEIFLVVVGFGLSFGVWW